MKSLKYLPILLLGLLILQSCENTSQPRFEGDTYSVAGLLVANQAISLEHPVYVTRSSAIEDFDPLQLFVFDAEVLIRDLDTEAEFQLQPALDEMKVKYIDPEAHVIQPEHRYRIEVRVPGYAPLIWAETTVPPSVQLLPDPWGTDPAGTGYSFDPASANATPFSAVDSQYPVVLNTGAVSGDFNFFGQIYCLEDFSTDLEFTTTVLGIEHPDESLREVYEAGGAFRRITFLYPFTTQTLPGYEGNFLVLDDYAFSFVLYGRYSVSAYIVDDNYYRYTYMQDGYLHGGIHNALGYFGAASGGVMYIKIVK